MTNYTRRATGTAMNPGMNYLSDLVIRPGIEKRFGPLLLYRGSMNRGHAHRLWNAALLMMAAEAETLGDGVKLFNNAAFNQLCGPTKAPHKFTLYTYFQRLGDNPSVTKNIPGFTSYIKSLELGDCILTRVDRFSEKAICAPWRKSLHENPGQEPKERGIPKREELFYPFMVHDTGRPDDGFALVKLVNSVVPNTLPDQMRADVCQEMIVGILSGDIAPGAAADRAEEMVRRVWATVPGKWEGGFLKSSLDAPVHGTEDASHYDLI